MKVTELKNALAAHRDAEIQFELPDGARVPAHAHVTEIGRVEKRFVDCGGTRRTDVRCQMQTWVANDLDHRLTTGKLLGILNKAQSILESDELEVDVEHEVEWTSQFPLASAALVHNKLVLTLGVRHTACLAQDKCMPKPSLLALPSRPSPIDFNPLAAPKACCG